MTVTTFGSSVWSTGQAPIYSFAEDGDEVRVLAGVTLHNRGDAVIEGRSNFSGLKATIDGTVLGWGWAALDAFDSSIAITVGSTGSIRGGVHGVAAIEASLDSSLVNHGTVVSPVGFGAIFAFYTNPVVENHGTIQGLIGGLTFGSPTIDGSTATVFNSGTIAAGAGGNGGVQGQGQWHGVCSDAASTTIINLGTISTENPRGAGVRIDGATADIVNEGRIEATRGIGIEADAGSTLVILNSGTIAGEVAALALGAGRDSVTNDGTITGDVTLGDGNDSYYGEGGRLVGALRGGGGDDDLIGGRGDDSIFGGTGNDFLSGDLGTDRLEGGLGSDTVSYALNRTPVHIDLAAGQASFPGTTWAAETLVSIENAVGGSGDDLLVGTEGRNTLKGGEGDDTIAGGPGVDQLFGGEGADVFLFASTAAADGDRIVSDTGSTAFEGPGATEGDRIDLSGIDANATLAGEQAWVFGTSQDAGHLWAVDGGRFTWIRGNIDNDPDVEIEIGIRDYAVVASAYTADDFIL